MERLILLTSKNLYSNASSLEEFKSFLKNNSKNLSIVPFNDNLVLSESDINLKLNELLDLIVKAGKWEILYYIVTLIRNACHSEKIDLTRLLETITNEAKAVCARNKIKEKIFLIEKVKKTEVLISYTSKRVKNKKFKIRERSSKYRGVSKTGMKWQVLLMNKRRLYYGSYYDELEAAKTYDFYAMKHFGKKAKTNFSYSKEELERIMLSLENDK